MNSSDPDLEPVDATIEISAAPVRRQPRLAIGLATAALLVAATASWWTVRGGERSAERDTLDAAAIIAETSGSTASVTGPSTGAGADTSVDAPTTSPVTSTIEASTTIPPTSDAPTTDPLPRLGFDQVYMSSGCSMGATAGQCAAAFAEYCAAYPPAPWFVPNVVGRFPDRLLTNAEIEHAKWYMKCEFDSAYAWVPNVVGEMCTANSSLAGTVAAQGWRAGELMVNRLRGFDLTVYRLCAASTTIADIPAPTSPATTSPPLMPPTTTVP